MFYKQNTVSSANNVQSNSIIGAARLAEGHSLLGSSNLPPGDGVKYGL